MARKKRLCLPYGVHYVRSDAHQSRILFKDDKDRIKFLQLLAKQLQKTGFICFSYDLKDTCYILVLKLNYRTLDALTRELNSEYAIYYNIRHNLKGHLFQDRPKSMPVQDILTGKLLLYVNAQSIKDGRCNSIQDLDHFPWCGHSIINDSNPLSELTLKLGDVLSIFGNPVDKAKINYHKLLCNECSEKNCSTELPEIISICNQNKENKYNSRYWVIGNDKFAQYVFESDSARRSRVAEHVKRGYTLENLAEYVSVNIKVSLADMKKRGYMDEKSDARKLFCYFAIKVLDILIIRAAEFFNISCAAINRLSRLGKDVSYKYKIELPLKAPVL